MKAGQRMGGWWLCIEGVRHRRRKMRGSVSKFRDHEQALRLNPASSHLTMLPCLATTHSHMYRTISRPTDEHVHPSSSTPDLTRCIGRYLGHVPYRLPTLAPEQLHLSHEELINTIALSNREVVSHDPDSPLPLTINHSSNPVLSFSGPGPSTISPNTNCASSLQLSGT